MTNANYRAVDHVLIRVLAAEPLYALFSDVFALPVSWPLQRNDFATFGWVNVGNTNLEFWAAVVRPGRILFEVDGVDEKTARASLSLAAGKLPIKTKFIKRRDLETA